MKKAHSIHWEKDKNHFIHPYTNLAKLKTEGSQVVVQAKGNYIFDNHGNKFLDGIAGLWCVNVGHGREEIANAISEQAMKMQYYNPFGHTTNEPAAILAGKLAELAPGDLNHVYFTCGGSTANDSAIRIIHYYNNLRDKPNKKKIISRNDAYHGSTYLTANLTGIHGTKGYFTRACDDWISHVSAANLYRRPKGAEFLSEQEYTNFLALELENHIINLGPDNIAAFIAEPVMGAGGVLIAPEGYHKRVWEICQKYDVLFIADEVVTAFGRLGEWFSSEKLYGFTPDIMIVAKGINSGYVPLGAAIISSQIFDTISESDKNIFSMGFTYTGHAVACAAALKNFSILEEENIFNHVRQLSPHIHSKAEELYKHDLVGDIRSQGFMLGIELVEDRNSKKSFPTEKNMTNIIYGKCIERGVIVRPVGNTIILSPPLTLTENEAERIIDTLDESIAELNI